MFHKNTCFATNSVSFVIYSASFPESSQKARGESLENPRASRDHEELKNAKLEYLRLIEQKWSFPTASRFTHLVVHQKTTQDII